MLPVSEMVSFGREGLLDAARRYDPERGVPFRRFAHYRVRGAVLDGMRRHAELPRRAHEKVKALRAANSVADGMWEDTAVAVASGIQGQAADQRLADHLAVLATAMAVGISTDLEVARDERGTASFIDPADSAEDAVLRAELLKVVHQELDRLPEPEGTLIRRHILGEEGLEDVSASVGLSKSWGSRIMARGIQTLSRRLQAMR